MKSTFIKNYYSKLLFAICLLFVVTGYFTLSTPQSIGQYFGSYNWYEYAISILRIFSYTAFAIYPLSLFSKNKVWKNLSIFVLLPAFIIYDISIFTLVQVQIYRYEFYQLLLHIIWGVMGIIYPICLIFYNNYTKSTKWIYATLVYISTSALFIPLCMLENTSAVNNMICTFSTYGIWWFVQLILLVFAILIILSLPKIKKENALCIMLIFAMAMVYHLALNNSYNFIKYGFNSLFTNLPLSLSNMVILLLPICIILDNKYLMKTITPIGIIIPIIAIIIPSETSISVLSYQYFYGLIPKLITTCLYLALSKYLSYYTIKDIMRLNAQLLIYLVIVELVNCLIIGQNQLMVNYAYLMSCPFYIGQLDAMAYVRIFGANVPTLYLLCVVLLYLALSTIMALSINGLQKITQRSKRKQLQKAQTN